MLALFKAHTLVKLPSLLNRIKPLKMRKSRKRRQKVAIVKDTQHAKTQYNTLQHTATHYITWHHIAPRCTTLHHQSAAHCILDYTAAHCNTL